MAFLAYIEVCNHHEARLGALINETTRRRLAPWQLFASSIKEGAKKVFWECSQWMRYFWIEEHGSKSEKPNRIWLTLSTTGNKFMANIDSCFRKIQIQRSGYKISFVTVYGSISINIFEKLTKLAVKEVYRPFILKLPFSRFITFEINQRSREKWFSSSKRALFYFDTSLSQQETRTQRSTTEKRNLWRFGLSFLLKM